MRTVLRVGFAAALLAWATPVVAQHEAHTTAGAQPAGVSPEQVTACVQSQQQVMALVDAANQRIEMARQTNEASAMRAAMDEFQAMLSAVRTQLASCAQLTVAAPAADPHAAHVMPAAAQADLIKDPGCRADVDPQTAPQAAHDGRTYYFCAESDRQRFVADPARYLQAAPVQATPAQARQVGGTDSLTMTVRTVPTPPQGAAENGFEVTVKDRQGKPVDGADVSVMLFMPAMPAMKMPEMRNEVKLKGAGNGTYTGTGQIMMAGPWTVTVSVKQNGKEIGQQKVAVTAK